MIKITSNKKLKFPPSYEGIVTMEVDLVQIKPGQKSYELRIIDSCIVNDKNIKANRARMKALTYDQVAELAQSVGSDDPTSPESIEEIFSKGLLLITQGECQAGDGMYFSQAQDWEIVK